MAAVDRVVPAPLTEGPHRGQTYLKEGMMANCRYCGKPAGFLKLAHNLCEEKERERTRALDTALQEI